MMSTCLKPFDDGEYFNYNIWIPADEYRPLTPTPSVSSASSVTDGEELEEELDAEADLAGAFADKVGITTPRILLLYALFFNV